MSFFSKRQEKGKEKSKKKPTSISFLSQQQSSTKPPVIPALPIKSSISMDISTTCSTSTEPSPKRPQTAPSGSFFSAIFSTRRKKSDSIPTSQSQSSFAASSTEHSPALDPVNKKSIDEMDVDIYTNFSKCDHTTGTKKKLTLQDIIYEQDNFDLNFHPCHLIIECSHRLKKEKTGHCNVISLLHGISEIQKEKSPEITLYEKNREKRTAIYHSAILSRKDVDILLSSLLDTNVYVQNIMKDLDQLCNQGLSEEMTYDLITLLYELFDTRIEKDDNDNKLLTKIS